MVIFETIGISVERRDTRSRLCAEREEFSSVSRARGAFHLFSPRASARWKRPLRRAARMILLFLLYIATLCRYNTFASMYTRARARTARIRTRAPAKKAVFTHSARVCAGADYSAVVLLSNNDLFSLPL